MPTVVLIEDQVSYGDAFALAMSLTKDLDLIARASDAAVSYTHLTLPTTPYV